MARPRTGAENSLRSNVQALRLDDAERAAIEQAAADAGLSVSELIRHAVLRDIGYLQAGVAAQVGATGTHRREADDR